jgi:hypothetical protein
VEIVLAVRIAMHTPSSRAVFRIALAAWLLVVTSAGSLRHAHAEGDVPHSHGFGLLCSHPAQHPCPSLFHRHLILLGLELFETDDSDRSDDEGWTFGLTAAVKVDAGASPPYYQHALPAIFADLPLSPLSILPESSHVSCWNVFPSLCPSADRARTGVLRT